MLTTEFWASFQRVGQDIFRYDTRIYLHKVARTSPSDVCIGAVVGKNPGSAKASNLSNPGIQPIFLDGDKMLPTVRNIVLKAYAEANIAGSAGEYIQVLNLFYLCEPNLTQAIKSISKHSGTAFCQPEANSFPWVWYVWGDENKSLSNFKTRFSSLNAPDHFYFDKDTEAVIGKVPSHNSFAKHTQGLKQESVITHISGLI